MVKRIVDVLVPVALDQAYSYRVPAELDLAPGDVVVVPLGARDCHGVVWAENPNPNPRLDNRMKEVAGKVDVPPFRPELRAFVDWMSTYTLIPRGMVLRMTLRMGEQLGPERLRLGVRLVGEPPGRVTPARARVLRLLADGMLRPKGEAAEEAGVSPGVIDGLVDEGTLEVLPLPAQPVAREPDPDYAVPDFMPAQADAAAALRETVAAGGFSVTLVDGVTGSGKTEVYFEAVAETMRRGGQALILMPEIALTGAFLERFASRFGVKPAEWHSEITPRKRPAHLVGGRERRGPRRRRRPLGFVPALCGPETHHRRRGARRRLQAGGRRPLSCPRHGGGARPARRRFPVVLASATPSVETEVNAAPRPLSKARFAGTLRRPGDAINRTHRPDPRRPRRPAASSRRASPARSGTHWSAASRHCCSSIAAAMRHSHCAAPAGTASPARTATPGWSTTVFEESSCATIAASPCRRRPPVRNAARPTAMWPADRAWNGSAKRSRSSFPMPAPWCCRPISSPRSSACARS